ncbi:MAG TPA: outer membrane beta-barrel protein [Chlamydiales bacterium]|nr:outer membrane beta-barrel protein [Chlamydiales bacterium]
MRLKTCGALLLLSAFSLFAEEDLSVGQLRKRLAATSTSETSTDNSVAAAKNPQTPCKTTKPVPCQPCSPCCVVVYPQRFQVGGTYAYSWITPKGNPTTSGNLGGVQAIYEYRPLGSVYAGAAFNWRAGKTTKDDSSRTLEDFNLQERLGYTFRSQPFSLRLTLFTGVGARYMAEKVKVESASVKFDYTEFYVPVGFLVDRQVISSLSIGLNAQWMPQVFPMVKIKPLSGARWDLTYQWTNFSVDMPFTITPLKNKQFSLIIDPFFEYWRDGHTTAKTNRGLALNLPGNTYLFAGVNVNLAFSF